MKLDVKELIAKLTNTPVVVEQGTDGTYWTWRKWSNGLVEAWYYRGSIYLSGTNTAIAIPSAITVNTSKFRNCLCAGVGSGFVADVHHCWVRFDGTEVYVTPTATGTYSVSIYIAFEQ